MVEKVDTGGATTTCGNWCNPTVWSLVHKPNRCWVI